MSDAIKLTLCSMAEVILFEGGLISYFDGNWFWAVTLFSFIFNTVCIVRFVRKLESKGMED